MSQDEIIQAIGLFLITMIVIQQPIFAAVNESFYDKKITVTVAKKGITGKNLLFEDIRTVLGTKGELFNVDELGYFIIDVGKTYTFYCHSWSNTIDSCVINFEIELKK